MELIASDPADDFLCLYGKKALLRQAEPVTSMNRNRNTTPRRTSCISSVRTANSRIWNRGSWTLHWFCMPNTAAETIRLSSPMRSPRPVPTPMRSYPQRSAPSKDLSTVAPASKPYDMMQDLKENVKNWRSEIEIEEYLTRISFKKDAFDKSGLIYGIGHAVYTVSDPRTKLLRDYARALAYEAGREKEYELYTTTERMAPDVFHAMSRTATKLSVRMSIFIPDSSMTC